MEASVFGEEVTVGETWHVSGFQHAIPMGRNRPLRTSVVIATFRSWCNIKVEHALFCSQRLVQLYGRVIQLVSLHIDDVGAPIVGYMPQFVDQFCCYALSAVQFLDGEVVNVNFPSFLFEFLQNVCSQSADNLVANYGDQGDKVGLRQQRPQILILRHSALVCVPILECVCKDAKQLF
jgi:hypothetical protein